VRATLGAKTFAVFHIDVVVGTAMSGKPDEVSPQTPLHIDGLVRPSYRTFPLPDHLADKYCTILGTHIRGETVSGNWGRRPAGHLLRGSSLRGQRICP